MHTLMDGRTVDLSGITDDDRQYLDDLARGAASGAPFYDLLMRVEGPGAHTTKATDGRVTPAVIASPVYQVAQDIANRAGVAQGKLRPPSNAAPGELLTVPQAAKLAGVSRQALNAAIDRKALKAQRLGEGEGTWVVRLEDLREYQERTGRRRRGATSTPRRRAKSRGRG